MRSRLLFFGLLLLAGFVQVWNRADLKAQLPEGLSETRMHFDSPFQEKYFKRFLDQKEPNHLALLLALDPDMDEQRMEKIRIQLEIEFRDIRNRIKSKSGPSSKFVFNHFRKGFLKDYTQVVPFHLLFSSGEYNCVTASALYCLALDHLKIPYKVQEQPDHVFLLVEENGERALLESTRTKDGFFVPDQKFKRQFLKRLEEEGIIFKAHRRQYSNDELFERWFYPMDGISLTELIGLMYYNDGLKHFQAHRYDSAVYQFEKAHILYPAEKHKVLVAASAGLYLQGRDYRNMKTVDFLARLFNLAPKDKVLDNFIQEFSFQARKLLSSAEDSLLYHAFYSRLEGQLIDPDIREAVMALHFKELSRGNLLNGKYRQGLAYAVRARGLKGNDHAEENLISACLLGMISQMDEIRSMLDTLEVYAGNYPFLQADPEIAETRANCYLSLAYSQYSKGELNAGNYFLDKFEQFPKPFLFQPDQDLLWQTYAEGAGLLLTRGDEKEAKAMLARGGKLFPGNAKLKRYYLEVTEGLSKDPLKGDQ